MRKIATKIVRVNGPYRFLTAYAAYYFLINISISKFGIYPATLKRLNAVFSFCLGGREHR